MLELLKHGVVSIFRAHLKSFNFCYNLSFFLLGASSSTLWSFLARILLGFLL